MPKPKRQKVPSRAESEKGGGSPVSARDRVRKEAMEHRRSLMPKSRHREKSSTIAEIKRIQRQLWARRRSDSNPLLSKSSSVRGRSRAAPLDGGPDDSDEERATDDLLGMLNLSPSSPPSSPSNPMADEEDDDGQSGVDSAGEEEAPPGVPPWIASCVELDEMRGRIAPEPLNLAVLQRGAEGGDDVAGFPQDDPPPMADGVICQIQNWVVRLDCVPETLSVEKAFRQARQDMRERFRLRRWARLVGQYSVSGGGDEADGRPVATTIIDQGKYNEWYQRRLAQRTGVADWRAVMRVNPDRRGPVWPRSATHVTDLVHRIERGAFPPMGPAPLHAPALNLYDLVYNLLPSGGRYDTNNFSALRIPNMAPRATCLIYSSPRAQSGSRASARAVCTGAKTPDEVAWSIHNLMRTLEVAGSPPLTVDWGTYKVSNVVASVILLAYTVNLKELNRQCGMACSYAPSTFPAAILRLRHTLGRVTVLVYSTKLVIVGSKSNRILTRTLRAAIRVTWMARHTDLKSEGAQAMLRPHERVFKELVADRRAGMAPDATPWGIAIHSGRASKKKTTT
jgi:TATA-box binding protein (TBP) (component of TFIID and TFIIIB)